MIAARRAKALAIRAASGAKRCMRDSPLNSLSTRQHPSQFEAANAPASLGVQYGSRACGCSRRAGPAGARIRALRPPREPGRDEARADCAPADPDGRRQAAGRKA